MTMLVNPSGVSHEFGYNKVNHKSGYQTPLSGSYLYSYDQDRRLTGTRLPSGKQITHFYSDGRIVRTDTPDGSVHYSYEPCGNLSSMTKGGERIEFAYDGDLITDDLRSGTLNQSILFTYNTDFLVSSMSYAGDTINLGYDHDELLTAVGNFNITRNAGNGLPENVSDGSLEVVRTFNGYGEIGGMDHLIGGHSILKWNLNRDATGRIVKKSETVDGTVNAYDYTYDPMGRLLTVTRNGTLLEEYRYDGRGVRIFEMNALRGISSRSYSYSEEDHLLSAGNVQYHYDPDGFLTRKTDGTNVTEYTYLSSGELLAVVLPNGPTIEYLTDPLGRRIAKKVDGIIKEKYLWQGMTKLLAVFDGGENLTMRFQYADDRMPCSVVMAGATYYLAYDQVGSLRSVADSGGNVIKSIDYDAFGNMIFDSNPTFEIPIGFAGGLHDPHTGLVRFGHRDYDPDIGRWTAKDPIGFAGGDTDLYGYVINNPINKTDPFGLADAGMTLWGNLTPGQTLDWITPLQPIEINPVKTIVALGNAANAGRLYASGVIKIAAAGALSETGIGISGSIVLAASGFWNIRGGMVAQNRAFILWDQAMNESWDDASWKNIYGLLPYGEQYDDPCEASFSNFWENKLVDWYNKPWEFISEIGTLGY